MHRFTTLRRVAFLACTALVLLSLPGCLHHRHLHPPIPRLRTHHVAAPPVVIVHRSHHRPRPRYHRSPGVVVRRR